MLAFKDNDIFSLMLIRIVMAMILSPDDALFLAPRSAIIERHRRILSACSETWHVGPSRGTVSTDSLGAARDTTDAILHSTGQYAAGTLR